jgi:hypothetical protein
MATRKIVKGKVIEAQYYPAEKSIAVVLADEKTGKPTKPIQMTASSYHFRPDQDIDWEMEKLADIMRNTKWAITLGVED